MGVGWSGLDRWHRRRARGPPRAARLWCSSLSSPERPAFHFRALSTHRSLRTRAHTSTTVSTTVTLRTPIARIRARVPHAHTSKYAHSGSTVTDSSDAVSHIRTCAMTPSKRNPAALRGTPQYRKRTRTATLRRRDGRRSDVVRAGRGRVAVARRHLACIPAVVGAEAVAGCLAARGEHLLPHAWVQRVR